MAIIDQDFLFMNQPFPSEADVEVGVLINPSLLMLII